MNEHPFNSDSLSSGPDSCSPPQQDEPQRRPNSLLSNNEHDKSYQHLNYKNNMAGYGLSFLGGQEESDRAECSDSPEMRQNQLNARNYFSSSQKSNLNSSSPQMRRSSTLPHTDDDEKKPQSSPDYQNNRNPLSISSNLPNNFSTKLNLKSSSPTLKSSDYSSNLSNTTVFDGDQNSPSVSKASIHSISSNPNLKTSNDNSAALLKKSSSFHMKHVKPFSAVAYELLNVDNLESVTPEDTTLKNCIQQAIESWQQTERLEAQLRRLRQDRFSLLKTEDEVDLQIAKIVFDKVLVEHQLEIIDLDINELQRRRTAVEETGEFPEFSWHFPHQEAMLKHYLQYRKQQQQQQQQQQQMQSSGSENVPKKVEINAESLREARCNEAEKRSNVSANCKYEHMESMEIDTDIAKDTKPSSKDSEDTNSFSSASRHCDRSSSDSGPSYPKSNSYRERYSSERDKDKHMSFTTDYHHPPRNSSHHRTTLSPHSASGRSKYYSSSFNFKQDSHNYHTEERGRNFDSNDWDEIRDTKHR